MRSPAAIVLDRVTKVYDEPVVFDVSLEVQEGEFVTLLGPSGSGKTTILQMIGGFVQPTTGRIFFGGTDMTTLPPNKRPCNTIFQDLGLFPMTVARTSPMAQGTRVDAPTRRKRTSNMLESLPSKVSNGVGCTSFPRGKRQPWLLPVHSSWNLRFSCSTNL